METSSAQMLTVIKSDWYFRLLGEVLLAEKSHDEAIAVLKGKLAMKMPWLWDTQKIMAYNLCYTRVFLAQAYREKGEIDQAIEVYERFTDPNSETRDGRLIYPRIYYELAKLYETKGRKAKAIKLYEKFLSLWKDADSGLPEVEDARKRRADLRSH
jgi:tetratricopeptide (TPR) repeat protein